MKVSYSFCNYYYVLSTLIDFRLLLLFLLQFGLFYNLVDLIISVANIFISPNYFSTQKCNSKFIV